MKHKSPGRSWRRPASAPGFARSQVREFLTDGDAWFEFFLAHELHLTVEDLRRRMPQREFVQWRSWWQLKWEREERATQRRARKGR